MAKFTYNLPSGAEFTVVGPADATQTQSDWVFYNQVAAGALIGYQQGQTLSGTSVQTQTYSLSRLQRGTAGVGATNNLARATRSDILAGILGSLAGDPSGRLPSTINDLIAQAERDTSTNAADPIADAELSTLTDDPSITTQTLESMLQHLPIVAAMPNLGSIPVTKPVTQADVIQARGRGLGSSPVGPLSAVQTQSLKAQLKNLVDQPADKMSTDKGIGKFGFTCYQLEKVNYVKPTTQLRLIDPDPSRFESVMRSPVIWTGRDDITSIDQILGDEELQNRIQEELMQCGLAGLNASGVIGQNPETTPQPTVGWVYQSGSLTTTGLQQTTRQTLLGGRKSPIGALLSETTTNMGTITNGVAPNNPSNTLNLRNYYYNAAQSALTTQVNGQVGALVANASKFGPEVTSVWATAGGSNNFSRLLATGFSATNASSAGISKMLSTAPALGVTATNPTVATVVTTPFTNYSNFGAQGLGGIPDGITNQLTGQVNQLTSSMDLLGKSSQFATGFVDMGKNFGDLTSLDKLGELSSSGLSKIGDLAASSAKNLQGMAQGAVNSISSGLDKLGKIDVGSIADVGKLSGLVDKAGGLGGLLSKGGDLTKMFGGSNALVAKVKLGAGFSQTINRETVDAAVDRVIGSAKINPPTFGFPDAKSATADIGAAKEALKGVGEGASGALSGARETLGNLGVTGFGG